jgi:hypothetical protein
LTVRRQRQASHANSLAWLACHLLGIETEAELKRSPFFGPLFEGLIAAEIAKAQLHAGRRRELYYFRDQQGLEVDTSTPTPNMAVPMGRLADAWRRHGGRAVEMTVVHLPRRGGEPSRAIAPGVEAWPWPGFVAGL